MVDKNKWGTKRVCPSCGAKFYDLGKNPVKCPKCGGEFSLEELLKHSFASKAKKNKKNVLESEDDIPFSEDDVVDEGVEPEEDELSIIEDASDIGDDTHDMAEIIGNLEKGNLGE